MKRRILFMEKHETVAILGASTNPERYSYKALKMLAEHGHTPLPVNPSLNEIEGVPVMKTIDALPRPVDTLTIYVKPAILATMVPEILALSPKRVIFNPGTESPQIAARFRENNIETMEACTLVLLSTGQF
ncbi:CoA-binding protein [Myxococcota bacterium]|nr:CoA-binding protein [Myxococcota bacterium]MBU1535984.1 CoA-binding protein [Myxococcota bacterium]